METKFKQYSKMNWLNKEIERHENSSGRNEFSDYYYKILLEIKTSQEKGTISDELYAKLNSWKGIVSPERGYYMSNINYDLFSDVEAIEDTEKRILHFFAVANKNVLRNNSWFKSLFISDFRYFMRHRYNIIDTVDDETFFEKYGNDLEKKIFNEYKAILKGND